MGPNDEADEQRRREESVAELREAIGRLARIEETWLDMTRNLDPVTNNRQVAALVHRVAELLESTGIAAETHPSERPLAPFLDACHSVEGLWELDTCELQMHLTRLSLGLPPLPLPTHEDGTRAALAASAELLPPPDCGLIDTLVIQRVGQDGVQSYEHSTRIDVPVLADGMRTRLIDAIGTATVMARASQGDGRGVPAVAAPKADDDVDAARTVDRLLDLFAGLELAIARGEAAGRRADGASPADAEIANRRRMLFDEASRIRVTIRHALPENTLEPIRLHIAANTARDPDGLDVLPAMFELLLDLTEEHRGTGLLSASSMQGRSERAVHLPRVADLWSEHLESAIRRAEMVVPAVRRRPIDELEFPVPSVAPPIAEESSLHDFIWDVPF
jgi:hypothetical protein